MKKIFVGGPIQHVSANGSFNSEIKQVYINLFEFLTKNGFEIYSAHLEENFGSNTHRLLAEDIYIRDSSFMEKCDIYLFILFGSRDSAFSVRSDGTFIELGWALKANKKIVVISSQKQLENCSYLLKGAIELNKIIHFESLDQFQEQIGNIMHEL